jgi:hypothetical protein
MSQSDPLSEVVIVSSRIDRGELKRFVGIRPSQRNPSMDLEDPALRARVAEIVHDLVGTGEPL